MSADPPRPTDGRYGWRLSLAGALVGIAAGGLLVSLLTHLGLMRDWYAFGHPPAAEIAAAQWVPHELSRSFHWRYWPRLMCYAFGVYIGWYLGTAPRPGGPAGRPDDIDEETD